MTSNKASCKIANNLAALRRKHGLSAAALAKSVGVSRQTVYAMEAGTYVPNTAIALRMARAFGAAVEDLFSLPEKHAPGLPPPRRVTTLPCPEVLRAGQPVQLCQVGGRLVAAAPSPFPWYLPPSDALLDTRPSALKASVQPHDPTADFRNRLLVAGCDPAMAVLARHLRPLGVELVLHHSNSSESLSLLKQGFIHIGGTHLHDPATGESNLTAITQAFAARSVAAISFALWDEGLVTARSNPKRITGIADLSRKDVSFINRESGAGSRRLLDTRLKQLQLDAKHVRGYRRTAPGHLAAAWEVKTGAADCCLATEAAARVFGLEFIPLEHSRYDLVLRRQDLGLPAVQTLFDAMAALNFRAKLRSLGGYDTTVTGERLL